DYPWVFQEYIKGKAYCSYSIAQDGKLLAHSVYSSIYCAGQGATIHFEPFESEEILNIVEKIVKELNYTGQISFDFIRSDANNVYYPIECNPRATSGIYLFSESITEAFRSDYNPSTFIKPNSDKSKMVAFAMLIYALPTLRTLGQGKDFIKKFYKSKDVVFRLNDMKPFISQFRGLAYYADLGKKNNISLMEATTMDIEWNGK
ncbi:ATP-grasp domain-containing protein, partial [bacterium]